MNTETDEMEGRCIDVIKIFKWKSVEEDFKEVVMFDEERWNEAKMH